MLSTLEFHNQLGEGEGNVMKTWTFKNESPSKSLSNVQSYSKGGQRLEIARDLAKRHSSVKFEHFFECHHRTAIG